MCDNFSQDALKKKVALAALQVIEDGLTVALGSGSTVNSLVNQLPDFLKQKQYKQLRFVAASIATTRLAEQNNIKIENPVDCNDVDVAIDGADIIDKQFNLIKGGGGALLREKILARKAKHVIIVADETKMRSQLSGFPLAVEIEPFGHNYTMQAIASVIERYTTINEIKLRKMDEDNIFVTDGGHYIADVCAPSFPNVQSLVSDLDTVVGVIENGFFVNMADTVFVANKMGEVTKYEKER